MNRLLRTGVLGLALLNPLSSMGQGDGTILEVHGDKSVAMKVLKQGGIKTVELKGEKFVLPDIEISVPTRVPYGNMVVATAKFDRSKMPDNLVTMKYQWLVLQDGQPTDNFIAWPDGTKVIFGAGMANAKFTVILNVGCLFQIKETVKVVDPKDPKNVVDREIITEADINSPDPIVVSVEVIGPPTPPPPPGPPTPPPGPPTPTPPAPAPIVFPPGQFGLSQFTYDNLSADTNMVQAEKVVLAKALGTNLRGIASKINSIATYRDVAQILADTKSGNELAFASSGVPIPKSLAFKKVLGDKIYDLYFNKKTINDAADINAAWNEIALALDSIK